MTEWTLHITYSLKPYKLTAQLEYQSSQIMRIRVQGMKGSLLLETNYPILRAANSKKGMSWKIREGKMNEGTPETSRLLYSIIEQLEFILKSEFPASPLLNLS